MAIGYSFSAKNIYDTKITFAGQVQDGGTSEVPSGSFNSPRISDTSRNLPVTAHAIVKPFKYIISPGGIFGGESVMDSVYLASYSQTQDILIPAYIWPDSLSVTYDGADTVTLSWQVPLPEDEDFITGGNFEIQRSKIGRASCRERVCQYV